MQAIRRISRAFVLLVWTWALAIPTAAHVAADRGLPPGLRATAGLVYLAGGAICHQRAERSFHLGATPLPVCARCTGIYAGAALAAAMALGASRWRRRLKRAPASGLPRAVMAVALLPSAATLAWEWLGGVMPSNPLRALAGLPLGAAVAWIVVRAADADRQSG